MKKIQNSKGFTLIELLVVIVIIGILASFMMVNYIGVRARARDTQRKSDLRQVQTALELYRSDSGSYPAALPACGASLAFNNVTYVQKIPCDPSSNAQYSYQTAFGNSAYTLIACLENINDGQKDTANNGAACTGGATNRSYTLISP